MTAPTRPSSPLAHGATAFCPSCRECPSCAGGTARIPAQYRIEKRATPHAGIALLAVCTRCDGCGVTCPNLAQHQETA